MQLAALALLVAAQAPSPCDGQSLCVSGGGVGAWPVATLRAGYEVEQKDPAVEFIGANDGFRLDQARLGLGLRAGRFLRAEVLADAARVLPGSEPNDPVRPLTLALVDAWVEAAPSPWFAVRVGQTRMPGDREGMTARASMIFATRSVAASGVEPGRGFALRGLSAARDIGVVLGAPDAHLGDFAFDYRFALAAGNGSNVTANDNKWPAAFARLGVTFADAAGVALGGSFDPRTVGDVPEQQNEDELTGFAEVSANVLGLDLLGLALVRHVTFATALPDPDDANRAVLGYGFTGWAVYAVPLLADVLGLRAGYRASFFEPPVSVPDVTLLEHALAVRVDPPGLPLPIAALVDVTSLWQLDAQGVRTFGGNRVFALVQVSL